MRDPDRIPLILRALQRRWEEQPDLRLCQLLSHLTRDLQLAAVEDGALLELLGPLTDEERSYAQREPHERRSAWRNLRGDGDDGP